MLFAGFSERRRKTTDSVKREFHLQAHFANRKS